MHLREFLKCFEGAFFVTHHKKYIIKKKNVHVIFLTAHKIK